MRLIINHYRIPHYFSSSRSYLLYGIFLLFVCSTLISAQPETAMTHLLLPPSPLLNGMGRAGTALPSDEAYGFFYNPAHLGLVTPNANVVVQFYPAHTDWLPGFNFSDLTFYSMAFNLGYAFDLNWQG